MKKGMIVHVTKGAKAVEWLDLIDFAGLRRKLGVQSLRITATEDDVAEACWKMIAKGMHQISCIGAQYHPENTSLELYGVPVRLAG